MYRSDLPQEEINKAYEKFELIDNFGRPVPVELVV
jgi:hypothetical protein